MHSHPKTFLHELLIETLLVLEKMMRDILLIFRVKVTTSACFLGSELKLIFHFPDIFEIKIYFINPTNI